MNLIEEIKKEIKFIQNKIEDLEKLNTKYRKSWPRIKHRQLHVSTDPFGMTREIRDLNEIKSRLGAFTKRYDEEMMRFLRAESKRMVGKSFAKAVLLIGGYTLFVQFKNGYRFEKRENKS
jgi:hypothetical protein